jgi:hypothetical protein
VSRLVKSVLHYLTDSSEPSGVGAGQDFDNNPIDNLAALFKEFQNIDLSSPAAKLNETTISDNNGGRIEL